MDDLLLSPDPTYGTGLEWDIANWVARFGENPALAMGWLLLHGGWIIVLWVVLWGARAVWLNYRQGVAFGKKNFVVLAVDVPRATEQTVKAVENMFAHFGGAHSPPTFVEKWWDGLTQDPISCEIISIDGHIQYLIRTARKYRDLIEASVYAQYPDAEITEVEDYANRVPSEFPNDSYDCWACEMTPTKSDVYSLKTYDEFEHQLTSEFKDPLAVLLEAFSRLEPGEQAWYQIVMTPIDQKDYVSSAMKEIRKLTGQKEVVKKTMMDKALDLPLHALSYTANTVLGSAPHAPEKKKEEDPAKSRMWNLTPGERKLVEGVERKMSKIVFKVKIRFVYVARKEIFKKSKVVGSFVGSIKQFNTNDALALKPESKRVGVSSGMIFMKNRRNDVRKGRLIRAYRSRSDWVGLKNFHLSTEELATLWHLPVSLHVKAPQVKKTESKKSEPPINLPMG